MTYSAGYSDNSDATSDVSIENDYNVVEVSITDDSYSISEELNTDYTYKNTYLGEVLESAYVLSDSSRAASSQPDVILGGYNPSVIGAVDFYECQNGYGGVDLGEIRDKIENALLFGVSEYNTYNVNVDSEGNQIPQFGYDCVNIPIPGGWDYVDYTYYTDFQGSFGGNVIPIRTTPFGPPLRRSNINYSNGRTNKGVPSFGVIKSDKEIDFNFVKPDGQGVINDINKDTIWQSGPRVGDDSYTNSKQGAHPTGGAGAPMTPGVAFDPNSYSGSSRNYHEFISSVNPEQVFYSETRYDYQPVRTLIYVNHERTDDSYTTPDFGVMGVSGWLYGLQTKLSGSTNEVMRGYTPQYNHSGMAINYVYGVYKKDKSDEELETFEDDLKDYIEYVQDIIDEITAEENQTNSYNARFSNEPYSEHRLKPNYLGRFIEGGLLERQRKNILKDSEANHLLLQFTFEFICSKLPINEGRLPHEQEFPITSDRLNHQLASDGELSMETFLDYLYCVFSNVPDHVIATLGYIPKLSDLANFVHHEVEPTDPIYFRYYLYNFILWACRPTRAVRVRKFSIEKQATSISNGVILPSPTIWFEDDSYITLDEWLNYETGGFEQMCGRMDGEIRPAVITLDDGSEGYRELECWENNIVEVDESEQGDVVLPPEPQRVLMAKSEESFIALSGPITKLEEGQELANSNVSRAPGVFYDMLSNRKNTLRNIYRSWARSNIDELSYEIPSDFSDGAPEPLVTRKAANGIEPRFQGDVTDKPNFGFADPDTQAPFMNQWIREEMTCWWQENVLAVPDWGFPEKADPQNLADGTYEFNPWVPKSDLPPDVEMVSHYIWITYDDLFDDDGNPLQKPDFSFWFGDSKSGSRNSAGNGPWQEGGSRIRLVSKRIEDPDSKSKIYQIEVPSGQKASRNFRFFRIGAYFAKGSSMKNDPKVMGKKEDWKYGKKFKFEIRPAKKVETDIGKDPNKGPVYHALRNSSGMIMKQAEPKWYDEYWKNPRNFIKDGQTPLNMNQWYQLTWNPTYVKDKVKPHCRFWWGKNRDSITPMEVEENDRKGLFFSTSQVLYKGDDRPYVFKPRSKYLYFGGFDSGRNMDEWSDDGEPWVVCSRRSTPPKVGPAFFADYSSDNSEMWGDVQSNLIHWEEEMETMPDEKMSMHTYTILQKTHGYINYTEEGPPILDQNLPIRNPISSRSTKVTRCWRFKKSVPTSMRESHRFQYLTNGYMTAPKLIGKKGGDLYAPGVDIAKGEENLVSSKHTNTPYLPKQLGDTLTGDAIILHDSSNIIQFGRYETVPDKVEGSGNNKVARTLENWSRLGEPEQVTCVPVLSPTGSFYWALSNDNSGYMPAGINPGVVAEYSNNLESTVHIQLPGIINPYHRHWPGHEGSTILQNPHRFNTVNEVFNHKFDDTKPETADNPKQMAVKTGKYYKFKFPTEEEALKIVDQLWRMQHEQTKALMPPGTANLPGVDDPNLKYNLPLGMKFRVNWVKKDWMLPPEWHTDELFDPQNTQKLIPTHVAWEDELFEPGQEYVIKAKGDAFVFGVADFREWRLKSMQFGSQLYKDQEVYDSTDAYYGNSIESKSMFDWSPYGIHFPFYVETAEKKQGPEYYANPYSYIETEIPDQIGSDFRQTRMGEINFAKSDKEVDKRKGDWWKMPMSYWTPGKDDHDFHEDMYKDGKAKATKIKAHRMYKVSWMKAGVDLHPWDCDFVFVDDDIKSDNSKLISRFHYANEEGQYGELLGNEQSAFIAPETYYFPDKGGYCKDKDGQVIRLQKTSLSGYVLLLSTSENLIMGSHNPAIEGAAKTPYKTEGAWQKKGEKTHLRIEETTVDYWQDGWAYWAANGHDDAGRANFFSKHWNLPMKHIAPGFIVEGDEYEVVAMPNMSPNIVYHLWWAPAGIEDHFEEIDRNDPSGILQDMLKNSLKKSETTLVAGTTIKVKAKGDRLLLAATNTGILREDLWNPNAEGAPLKIRRLPIDRDPIGPGYYGTRSESNNTKYGLSNIHWKEIWDWNSWMTFQDETYSANLDRFVRGRTYRLKRRTKDYSDFACGEGYFSTGVLPSTRLVDVQVIPDHTDEDGSIISGKRTIALPDFSKYPNMQRWDLGPVPRQRVTLTINPETFRNGKYTWLLSNSPTRPTNNIDARSYFEQIIPNSTMEQTLFNVQSRYLYVVTSDLIDDDDVPSYGENGRNECFSVFVQKPSILGSSVDTAMGTGDEFSIECSENEGMLTRAYHDNWNDPDHHFNDPHFSGGVVSLNTDSNGDPLIKGKKYDISIFAFDQIPDLAENPSMYMFSKVRVWWSDSPDRMGDIRLSDDNDLFLGDIKDKGCIGSGGYKTLECGGRYMFLGMVDQIAAVTVKDSPKEGIRICVNITDDITTVPPQNPALPPVDGGTDTGGGGGTCPGEGFAKASVYSGSESVNIGGSIIPVPDLSKHDPINVFDLGVNYSSTDDIEVELDDTENNPGDLFRIVFTNDLENQDAFVAHADITNGVSLTIKKKARFMLVCNHTRSATATTSYHCMKVTDVALDATITQTLQSAGSGTGTDESCPDGFELSALYPAHETATINGNSIPVPDFSKYETFAVWNLSASDNYSQTTGIAVQCNDPLLNNGTRSRVVFTDSLNDQNSFKGAEYLVQGTTLNTTMKAKYMLICSTNRDLSMVYDYQEICVKVINKSNGSIIEQTEYQITGGGATPIVEIENQATPPGGNNIPLGDQYEYEVIGAEDPQALKAGPGNSNRFTLYGELSKQSEYLDIKGIPFVEVVFSTINTPMSRTLQDWGPEGEEVFIDTYDFGVPGEDYISGPGYYGKMNGSQFIKPDFCNLHYLSPLNAVSVLAETGYRIRRSQKDPNKFMGTGRVYGVSDEDLTKQHGQNSRFNDYDVTLPSRVTDAYPDWEHFVTNKKTNIIFGVYKRAEKDEITDWSIDGENIDYQLEEVDVTSQEGPLYWANYPVGDPLYRKVDWVSKHWDVPVNCLKKVTIKKISGEVVHNTQFNVDQTYIIKHKTHTDYDIHFYENSTGFPTTPSDNNDYTHVGTLPKGVGDNVYVRIKPSRPELFLGAGNIPQSDFRSKDHRFWSKRGIPCDLIFEEVNYLEGPGYWADHTQQIAASSKGGPWFSMTNQEGNIPSSFRVQAPVLSSDYWHEPINYLDGVASNQLYEVKPYGVAKYPYTITLWETMDRSSLKPGTNSKMVQWKKISETRRKNTNEPFLIKPSSRYIIVSCQETDVSQREEDWSPKGMPIELQFTRITEQEGASFYAETNASLKRGQTAWTNKHWKGYTFLGTSTGAPLIASMNYKVKVSKSTKNAKYRHSLFGRPSSKVSVPMTSTESGLTKYEGADVAKGAYGSQFNSAKIKGSGGNWLILSTHKFNQASGSAKNRTLTNWSPKGEFVELSVIALDSNLVPDHGLIGKILGALSALASALLLLLLLFKYVPPTDWLLEFNLDGPKNEVFPSRIPCEDPDNEGELPDGGYTYHGWRWDRPYNNIIKNLPPHGFFWTAEPKWLNVYADQMSSLYARALGLRHHGYFFDTTCYEAHEKNYKASGIGFCNLTQTFGFGVIRPTNLRVKRLSLADQKGQKSKFTSWAKSGVAKSSSGKSLDTTSGLSPKELEEREEHIKKTNAGIQDEKVFSMQLSESQIWHKNSRRTYFSTTVNPQFFQDRQTWENPNVTSAKGYFSWPRTLNTRSDSVYKRAGIDMRDRWFMPAMVRAVDCYYENTTALATTSGLRNLDRDVYSDTKNIKTMKMGENRKKEPKNAAGDDLKVFAGSVKGHESLRWDASGFPYTSENGNGQENFYDGIFGENGFTCYIYDYWSSNNTSHNNAWIMATEENTSWPTNADVEGETEWYFGMKFDLDTMVTETQMNRQQMVFMGVNFTTDEERFEYHELYPTKSSDYLFRNNGEVSTEFHLENQRTKIEMEVWSTKKVRYNSIFSKLYWGFYLFDESGGKNHYFGHNISNLKPLASTGDPRGNLIVTKKDWDNWKAEQAAQEQEGT